MKKIEWDMYPSKYEPFQKEVVKKGWLIGIYCFILLFGGLISVGILVDSYDLNHLNFMLSLILASAIISVFIFLLITFIKTNNEIFLKHFKIIKDNK